MVGVSLDLLEVTLEATEEHSQRGWKQREDGASGTFFELLEAAYPEALPSWSFLSLELTRHYLV